MVKVARPFSFNHGKVHHRYGVGVYDIPDPMLLHTYVQHHLEAAVLSRGEALVQHREPVLTSGWVSGDQYYRSLSRVSTIEPGPILIWNWPPQHSQDWHFGPHVEQAPGAVIALREMEPVPGSETNEWRNKIIVLAGYPGPPYHGHGTPQGYVPQLKWPFPDPQIGDLVQFGEPMSGGAPLAQLDMPKPSIPPEDPVMVMHRQLQTQAIEKAQRGVLLREAHIAATRAMARIELTEG